jgi:glycine/D-amino acid oxidase-like deaminating enzyme
LQQIHEEVTVEGFDASGSEVAVHTQRGVIRAESVALAVEASLLELAPAVPFSVIREQLIATEPVGENVSERPCRVASSERYWRQLSDGRLVVGGFREEQAPDGPELDLMPSRKALGKLEQFLRDSLGVTAAATHHWAGLMATTPDGLPLVGTCPGAKRCYLAGGFDRYGLGFAFKCARHLAELIVDGTEPPAWLVASRFASTPRPGPGSQPE